MAQSGFHILCEGLKDAPILFRETMFDLWLKTGMGFYGCGLHDAPEGRAGRDARSDKSASQFVILVQAVTIYLEAHPELEPMTSIHFAREIREDILDALGKPPTANSPSASLIVKAVRAVRLGSFAP